MPELINSKYEQWQILCCLPLSRLVLVVTNDMGQIKKGLCIFILQYQPKSMRTQDTPQLANLSSLEQLNYKF